MPYNSSFIANPATLESRKFIQIGDTTRFPILSVMTTSYDESYPANTSTLGSAVTALNTYNSYAILTKDVGGSTLWDTTSAAVTTAWSALASNTASSIQLRNDSGVTIQIRRAGTTNYGGVPIVTGTSLTVTLTANTSEVEARAGSSVTLHGILFG